MITFLVAGRNDGYGVNLHKRTAISLNYLASLCGDSEDEIIYVDCNSPEQDGALVEAIADTLTPECRRRLKCYRVSGEQMKAALGETPLPFSDELSRNVVFAAANQRTGGCFPRIATFCCTLWAAARCLTCSNACRRAFIFARGSAFRRPNGRCSTG